MKSQKNPSRKAPLPTTVVFRLADADTDDGPQPLKNRKPSAKNTNAADQFWSDHQEEHEKRAATPSRVDVQEFNKVPRLKENLDKMAALSKIKTSATVVAKQSSYQLEQLNKTRDNKQRLKDKQRRHKIYRSRSRTKKPELKSRVTKSSSRLKNIHKPRMSKSRYGLVENSNRCRCRYCMRVTNKGTCTNLVLKEASTLTVKVIDKIDAQRTTPDVDSTNTPAGSANSDYTNTNSHNSVASLHSGSFISNISHMSLDHEPMVTSEE